MLQVSFTWMCQQFTQYMWEYVSGEDCCREGAGEVTKGTAGQIKPTQQSLNLLKAFKGGSELILVFHAEICLRNQAGRWMRCSARGEQLTSSRGFRLWGCPLSCIPACRVQPARCVWALCCV